MAEVEYQVDEMLFKMNALAGTANLPEKPPNYFTDSDTTGQGDHDVLPGTGARGRCNLEGVSSAGQAAILRMFQVSETVFSSGVVPTGHREIQAVCHVTSCYAMLCVVIDRKMKATTG